MKQGLPKISVWAGQYAYEPSTYMRTHMHSIAMHRVCRGHVKITLDHLNLLRRHFEWRVELIDALEFHVSGEELLHGWMPQHI